MAYVTTVEVRRRASGGSGSGGSATATALPEPELEALIEQASRYFDLVCGVAPEYFEAAEDTATERVFRGQGLNYLHLDPYIPGTLTATYPDGYTIPDFEERQGYLVVTSGGFAPPFTYSSGWHSGIAITVSAKWGFQEVLPEVKNAVIELTLNLWRETDPATVKLVGLEGQPLREDLPPRVKNICRKLRSKYATGVAFA